ncbi:MAG: hypothetical protein QM743_02115 [Chitinophagaceae bacterium]
MTLIPENVLNFHSDDVDYYEEWLNDIAVEGVVDRFGEMPASTQYDFTRMHLDRYVHLMDIPNWRTFQPLDFFNMIDNRML